MKSFTLESVDQTVSLALNLQLKARTCMNFFGDGIGLLLFQDEVTALEYKLISIVHSLITTKVLIKLG